MSVLIQWGLIAALALGGVFGLRQWGVNSERRKCEAAAQQRAVEIMNKDIEIGQLQQKLDDAISAEQSEQERVDREVQDKLEAELAKRPVAAQCRATADDIGRLR